MIATQQTISALRDRRLARRDELRWLHALVDGAVLCDELLAERNHLTDDAANERLSLHQAIEEIGYSADIARYFGADVDADALEGEPALITGDEEQAAVARSKDRGGFAA